MGLFLLKWFGLYFLYVVIGCAFYALHIVAVLKDKYCWLFWPDVDVKSISPSFVYEDISARFCYYIIFLWPIRLLKILIIFAWFTFLWIAMGLTALFMLGYDFVTEKVERLKFVRGSGTIEKTS